MESEAFNESEMALFSECRPLCAQTVLDTADIVREGDVTTAIGIWYSREIRDSVQIVPDQFTINGLPFNTNG